MQDWLTYLWYFVLQICDKVLALVLVKKSGQKKFLSRLSIFKSRLHRFVWFVFIFKSGLLSLFTTLGNFRKYTVLKGFTVFYLTFNEPLVIVVRSVISKRPGRSSGVVVEYRRWKMPKENRRKWGKIRLESTSLKQFKPMI